MPNGADPDAVIRALNDVGVDFSVPRPSLVDFLGNPEFTPYPALAAGLLKLLTGRGRMLRRPVFIDVIVFNYEHSPGNPSPRRLEDVDFAVLEAAVLEGFNNRHGEQNTDFGSLLKPLDQGNLPGELERRPRRSSASRVQALCRSIKIKDAVLPALATVWDRHEAGKPSRNEFETGIYTVFDKLDGEQHEGLARAFQGYSELRRNRTGECFFDDRLAKAVSNRPLEKAEFAAEFVREGLAFLRQQMFPKSGGEKGPGQVRPWQNPQADDPNDAPQPWPWLTAIRPDESSPTKQFGNNESFFGAPGMGLVEPEPWQFEQTCEFKPDPSGAIVAVCERVHPMALPGSLFGGSCEGGPNYQFRNDCLRIPAQRPGGSIALRGFNFITPSVKVHLKSRDVPGLAPISQDCIVYGDRITAVKDEQGKVIADFRVEDWVDVPIPSEHLGRPLEPGLYEIRVSVSDSAASGGPIVRESNTLLLRIEPDPNVHFLLRSTGGRCIKETPGGGDDEIWWDAFVGHLVPNNQPLEAGRTTITVEEISRESFPRPEWEDVDEGDSVAHNLQIFGPGPFKLNGVVAVAIVGFEIDDEDAARDQLQGFWDAYFVAFKGIAELALNLGGPSAVSGLAELLVKEGAIKGAATALSAATVIAVYIAVITLIGTGFWAAWAPADLIALDFFILDPQMAFDSTASKKPQLRDTVRQFGGEFDENDVLVRVTQRARKEPSGGSVATLVQEIQYDTQHDGEEFASYALEFRLTRTLT
ncbi:MAG: hypothetical protein L0387_12885 [Acidobacteria bacterium]|nr:hypothetical protein [Acidobacteriota bacterium]